MDLKINEEAEINAVAPDHEFALRLSQLGVTIGQKNKIPGLRTVW
jgi:Fe2+ transport system protein FeoA